MASKTTKDDPWRLADLGKGLIKIFNEIFNEWLKDLKIVDSLLSNENISEKKRIEKSLEYLKYREDYINRDILGEKSTYNPVNLCDECLASERFPPRTILLSDFVHCERCGVYFSR